MTWCVVGTFIYAFFSPVWESWAAYIPDIDTKSSLFESWYFRETVNTTYFPLSQLFAYMGLSITGWTFINLVTLQKKNPFTSGNNHYKDFKILLIMAPIIFLMSGAIVLRQANDLSGYCDQQSEEGANGPHGKTFYLKMSHEDALNVDTLGAVLETDDDMVLLFHTLQESNYMKSYKGRAEPACEIYTQEEIYKWN